MFKRKFSALVGAAGIFLTTLTTPLFAGDTISIGGGVSGGATTFSVYGEEKLDGSNKITNATETGSSALGSAYGQISLFDGYFEDRWGTNGFTIGYEHIFGEAKIDNARDNINDIFGANNTATNIGRNYVEAVMSNLNTVYIETPGITPLGIYLKVGYSEMDIETREEMATGASFGNTSTEAETYGFGFKKSGGGFLVKTEFSYTDWDNITLNSSHSGPGNSGGVSSVTAAPENWTAKFGIGYSF